MQTALVIADAPHVINLCRTFLTAASLVVLVAESGPTGLGVARRDKPDIVIVDLGLSGMTSLDVCRALRSESSVPIMVLSDRHMVEDKLQALASGADDYITKPFSPRELVARVQAVLRRTASSPASG